MAKNPLTVLVMPASVGTATVIANGRAVGVIEQIVTNQPFTGFDGEQRIGKRWMPQGETVAPDVEGPTTRNEAALLLLALAGYDQPNAARALGFEIGAPA